MTDTSSFLALEEEWIAMNKVNDGMHYISNTSNDNDDKETQNEQDEPMIAPPTDNPSITEVHLNVTSNIEGSKASVSGFLSSFSLQRPPQNRILQLFSDGLLDSPVTREITDSEIASIITPDSKGVNSDESGIDVLTPLSVDFSWKPRSRRSSIESRRSLFSGKRLAEDGLIEESRCTKKLRDLTNEPTKQSQEIIKAVERLEYRDLIADGSRDYTLPTISGKHSDLKSITAETMADVVRGKYDNDFGQVTIVDCRYPYEYEGGHIRGAVNLYTKDEVHSLLDTPVTSEKPRILIFHCEFSSERGPKMNRFLRSEDREMNKHQYPRLNFPEVYLLHDGYKTFYETNEDLCDPISYKPMLHEDHTADLRHFRVKSKSWTAGEKQKTSRRHRSRLSRNLSFM